MREDINGGFKKLEIIERTRKRTVYERKTESGDEDWGVGGGYGGEACKRKRAGVRGD